MPYFSRPRSEAKTYSIRQHGRNYRLSENFVLGEFQSNDGADTVVVHPDIVNALQALRDEIGGPLIISKGGGYRTRAAHKGIYDRINAARKAKGLPPVSIPWQSEHLYGLAADVSSPFASVERIAHAARYKVGMGGVAMYRGDGFVHVDVGRPRTWADGVPPENAKFGPVQLSAGLITVGLGIIAGLLGWKFI